MRSLNLLMVYISLNGVGGAIGAVRLANIMGGYPDGSFKATSYIKRAEAVVALERALSYQLPSDVQDPGIIDITYDVAGTYGLASGQEIIKGNVVIKAKDVTLQNTVIEGDLIIDKSVGEGSVTLKIATNNNI